MAGFEDTWLQLRNERRQAVHLRTEAHTRTETHIPTSNTEAKERKQVHFDLHRRDLGELTSQ